ncbi:EAL domain-containing protein [Paraburkholderia sp. RL17-337-BIB-A]|uniref:EAL domain-containing protein n=1 Tax=Paraburkholderia sp. RL17-337-BIB-A TaxID=3031636 RepID=UPI0038BC407A
MLTTGGAFSDAGVKLRAGLDSQIAYNVKLCNDLRNVNNAVYSQAFWLLLSCMVAALVVSGGLPGKTSRCKPAFAQAWPFRCAGRNSPPKAVLLLYSAFPGGFTATDRIDFIVLLQTILGFAIARIERLEGSTNAVPYALRQHWSLLLRSDALQMHYQPLMDLKTGQIIKVEALARLRDSDRLRTPGEFFPALSSDDFVELHARGLMQALSQRNRWLRDGINLNVSVNLPPSALSHNRYFEATQQAVRECGCAPDGLTLEILETDAFPPGVDVLRELTRFKTLGIRLADADLGSGHSSLNRLPEVPFDLVKIDRNISNLDGHDASDALRFICQLIRLGHSLGKTVAVEGIEDAGMLEAVLILGADVAQGHAIAQPMPVEQVAKWLGSRPGLPYCRHSDTPPGKLASRLIWQERLHLLSEDPRAFAMPADISKIKK